MKKQEAPTCNATSVVIGIDGRWGGRQDGRMVDIPLSLDNFLEPLFFFFAVHDR